MYAHMTKKKKFKRGQLLQDQQTNTIYIYVKSFGSNKAYLLELDQHGDPVKLVIENTKYLGLVVSVPTNFKSIEI